MKVALKIVGAVLVFLGTVWLLQGINILPGSFMTGQIRWAVYGGIAVAAGGALLVAANRRWPPGSTDSAKGVFWPTAVGLCLKCVHARVVPSDREPTFYFCQLSATDSQFPKYPILPIRTCSGYSADEDAKRG
jgi:hypothetical protein